MCCSCSRNNSTLTCREDCKQGRESEICRSWSFVPSNVYVCVSTDKNIEGSTPKYQHFEEGKRMGLKGEGKDENFMCLCFIIMNTFAIYKSNELKIYLYNSHTYKKYLKWLKTDQKKTKTCHTQVQIIETLEKNKRPSYRSV